MVKAKQPAGDPKFHDTPLIVQVYEWLRDSICDGKFDTNSRLNIDQLSLEWKISKTPIREALNALHKDGLVDYAPRRGFSVKYPSFKELMDVLELREVLETYSLQRYFDAYDRTTLSEILTEFENAFQAIKNEGTTQYYLEVDARFHNFLILSTDNEKIIQTYQMLDANMRFTRSKDTHFLKELAGATISEHRAIIKAILNGDREAAMEALTLHLHNVRLRLTTMNDGD